MNQPPAPPSRHRRVAPRVVVSASSAGGARIFFIVLFAALLVIGFLFADSKGWVRQKTEAPATPAPVVVAATPAPATPPPVVEVVKAPEPVPEEKPKPPTPEELLQSRIDAARAVAGLRTPMARGDFAGATKVLDEWLQANPGHLQTDAVQGQAERFRAAAEVMPTLLAKPAALVGAKIGTGPAAWTVVSVTNERLNCRVQSQFGAVDRPIEIASLPGAALVPLLKGADAANQTTLAATYLLGLGRSAEARAAIPAASPTKDALLASATAWEKLARDYAVLVALEGTETLIKRGDFAGAGQRLDQTVKAAGDHDFIKTTYAEKITDWKQRIASAPPPPPVVAATPAQVASCTAPGAKPAAGLPPAPTAIVDAARKALLDGVSVAPRIGSQGPVAMYGAAAFPLLTIGEDKNPVAVGAAGISGKGRAVIFGHTGYISTGSQNDGDLGKLTLNAVQWCGQKTKPRVGFMGCDIGGFLDQHGHQAQKFSGPLKKGALKNYDVVIMNVGGLNDEAEATALKEYLDGGGGVIAAMTGWAFPQLNSGRQLYETNRANYALAGAGLGFTDASAGGSASNLQAQKEPAPLMNAYTAIIALQQRFATAPVNSFASLAPKSAAPAAPAELGSDEVQQAAKSLQLALAAMPPASRGPFVQNLSTMLVGGKPIVPSKEDPLIAGADDDKRAQASAQARLLKFLPAEAIVAHPAAAAFPGRVPAGAQPATKSVNIDPKIPGWHSTGLFADAGAKITVKIPADEAGKGYQVRIGCHTDGIYDHEKWPRLPEVTTTTAISTAETLACSPFGGLVYIVAPGKEDKPFAATISGAVEAPYFVLDETTDAQWAEIKKRPAPWAEFACRDMILSVPSDVAREVKNPTELMQYWQKAMAMHDDLSNVASERKRPERMVADVEISIGFLHSGYPIMLHIPESRGMVTVSKEKKPGWGFHHEIGHNHQKGEWTFDGTGEVTNNVFSIYLTQELNGLKRNQQHGAISPDSQAKKWARYAAMGKPFAEWKKDPFLALGTYIQLVDGFGWDSMKKYFRSYQDSANGPKPKTDDEKHDQFMVRYSKVVGKNLGPFFDAWGIPVSSSAKAEIDKLPSWMPPGLK